MLSKRFDYDAKPILRLNELQLRMKNAVDKKVRDGIYAFEEVVCPICHGSSFEPLAKKDRYGLYAPVVICKECGLIQTNPRMNQDAYNDFYNDEYRKLYGGAEGPTEEFFAGQYKTGQRIYRYLENNAAIKADGNMFVFEVGCGAGGILHYFRDQGFRVKGIDLGKQYIEFGRNRYNLDLLIRHENS